MRGTIGRLLAAAAVAAACSLARPACADPAAAGAEQGEHDSGLGQRIGGRLRQAGIPDSVVVVFISALPIVELRGAIPFGHWIGMNPWAVFALAVVGNMLPVPLILLLLGPLSKVWMRYRLGKAFFDWLFARTRGKTASIEKYETFGLTVFVAIPLPATGAWTGAAVAFVMGMSFSHALAAILLGVVIAGVIMTVVAMLGKIGAAIAGVVLLAMAIGALQGMLRKPKPTAPLP